MGSVRRGWDNGRAAVPSVSRTDVPSAPKGTGQRDNDGTAPDEDGQQHIIDLRDVPSRWPTMDGMVNPAPHAWRYEFAPDVLAAVDAFYRDLLWNAQLELDGVRWPGRADRDGVSVLAALRDVARLWHLPSAEETLPTVDTARQDRNARRHERRGPVLSDG